MLILFPKFLPGFGFLGTSFALGHYSVCHSFSPFGIIGNPLGPPFWKLPSFRRPFFLGANFSQFYLLFRFFGPFLLGLRGIPWLNLPFLFEFKLFTGVLLPLFGPFTFYLGEAFVGDLLGNLPGVLFYPFFYPLLFRFLLFVSNPFWGVFFT